MTFKEDLPSERILILDFGSQYSQLIGRCVRKMGVYTEVVPYHIDIDTLRNWQPRGIILSGGPESVTGHQAPSVPAALFELDIPILGICYGMQTMAAHFGGRVVAGDAREFGPSRFEIRWPEHAIFSGFDASALNVWMSHGDHVAELPKDFRVLGSTETCPIAAMAHISRPWLGFQFHPEVTHTPEGMMLLSHFVHTLCGLGQQWTMKLCLDTLTQAIQSEVGDRHILLALSGGVDSGVLAALLAHALSPSQVHAVCVDHGLMRHGEIETVVDIFSRQCHIPLEVIDARERFFLALKGLTEPEDKRRAIGETFIRVFEDFSQTSGRGCHYLAQGTIYSDVIESAGTDSGDGVAHAIKSHHNVGGLPEDMGFELLEPLRHLFKDEVRALGRLLGLPEPWLARQPFPGPGLAVRVLGEVHPEAVACVRAADRIFLEELEKDGLLSSIAQAFAVHLPVCSVGVVGDARAYAPVIALRAVQTTDFMTATASAVPFECLSRVASRIVNEIRGVSRVVYDITSKPPATIEWE